MKKRFWAIFALLVVFALGFAALTACTPTEPDPGDDNGGTEEPVDNTLQYLGEVSKALAQTIVLNPEKGFNMDLDADLGWHFKDAEKAALYDWGYAFSVKANVFAEGAEKQGLALELKDTKRVDNSENPAPGGGGGPLRTL